jgi:uncharacterized protein involved in exopolysaccharide biosynthesis
MTKELTTPTQNRQEVEILDPIFHEDRERVLREAEALALREKSVRRLEVLWGQRRFLARTMGIALIAALLIAFLIPKRFTSTAHLMPPDQGPGTTGMAMMAALAGKAGGSLGTLGGELLGLKTTGDLFIGILQSRTVEDDLIAKFNLRKVYRDRRWEEARKDLAKRTSLSQDRKSEIITISVSDRTAERAQQMAQEYVEQLNEVVATLNTTSAHRERVFLEGRLNEVQQDLESAEKDFGQFASKNTTIDIQAQGKAMIEAGAALEGQLIAAQAELEGLRQIFADSNVRVRETEARVDELKRQLLKLGGKAGSEGSSAPQDDALYPSIRQLPVLGVSYADLYRRMKVQEAVFETLTQQYELAKVEEAKETPSVKVLDPPDLPERKSFPPRLLIVCFATVLAFTFGVAWVLGHQAWEATGSTDVRKMFASQVLSDIRASMPWVSRNGRNGVHAHAALNSAAENECRNEVRVPSSVGESER